MSDSSETKQLFAQMNVERGALVVHIVGPTFGEREGPIIQKMIEDRLDEEETELAFVVLNFADVGFMNSSGLGACVMIHRIATAQKKKVVPYALSDELLKVIKMTQMDKLFKLAEDEKKLAKILK